MKKIVHIITVPLNKRSNNGIFKDVEDNQITFTESMQDNPYFEPQQLLVLTEDEIQKDDICDDYCDVGEEPYTHTIGKCRSVDRINGWIEFDGYKTGLDWCKKIIASYPQIEDTLPISKETIKAWIDANTPSDGFIFYDNEPDNLLFDTRDNLLLVFTEEKSEGWSELIEEASYHKEDYKATIATDEIDAFEKGYKQALSNKWIDVNQELPDKELIAAGVEDEYNTDEVIIAVKYNDTITVSTGRMFRRKWYWRSGELISSDFKVVKWQPMPSYIE